MLDIVLLAAYIHQRRNQAALFEEGEVEVVTAVEEDRVAMHREYWIRAKRRAVVGAIALGVVTYAIASSGAHDTAGKIGSGFGGAFVGGAWFCLVMVKAGLSSYFKGVDRTVRS